MSNGTATIRRRRSAVGSGFSQVRLIEPTSYQRDQSVKKQEPSEAQQMHKYLKAMQTRDN